VSVKSRFYINQRGSNVTAITMKCRNFEHGFSNDQARISDHQAGPEYNKPERFSFFSKSSSEWHVLLRSRPSSLVEQIISDVTQNIQSWLRLSYHFDTMAALVNSTSDPIPTIHNLSTHQADLWMKCCRKKELNKDKCSFHYTGTSIYFIISDGTMSNFSFRFDSIFS